MWFLKVLLLWQNRVWDFWSYFCKRKKSFLIFFYKKKVLFSVTKHIFRVVHDSILPSKLLTSCHVRHRSTHQNCLPIFISQPLSCLCIQNLSWKYDSIYIHNFVFKTPDVLWSKNFLVNTTWFTCVHNFVASRNLPTRHWRRRRCW